MKAFAYIALSLVGMGFFIPKGVAQYSFEDTIPLHEVIITAKSTFDGVGAGAVVQRIDTLVLMDRITGTMGELLAENTPVFIKTHGRGALATASMRGTGASHTAVLWNNIPINSPLTGQVDFSLIPVYLIDEMSLYFGSSSLQNSNGALGGSIAIENRPDWEKGTRLKFMQGFASFGTYSSFGQVNWSDGKWSARNRLFYESSENNFLYYYNDPRNQESSGYHKLKGASYKKMGTLNELFYRVNEQDVAGTQVWIQSSDRFIPPLVGNSIYFHKENQIDKTIRLLAFYKHYGERFSYELQSAYLDDRLSYYLINQANSLAHADSLADASNRSQSSINQWNSVWRFEKNWRINFDAEFRTDWVHSIDYETTMGYSHRQNQISAIVSVHKMLGDRWSFSSLLKYQWIQGQTLQPVPSLSAEYLLNKKNQIKLKGNISRNYHYPSLNDLYYLPGGNPGLTDEKGRTLEFSVHHQSGWGNFQWSQSVSSYYSIINDWIQWIPSDYGYWEPRNLKKVHSRGVEYYTALEYIHSGFTGKLKVQYAFTPTTNQSDPMTEGDQSKGNQLIYIPRYSAGMVVFLSYLDWELTTITHYLGERQTATTNDSQIYPEPSYWLTNLSLGSHWQLKKIKVGVKGKVENLWNTAYSNLKNRPMPLRNYSLLLKFEF
ncbi:MAG: hypothetical protein A2W96_01060 [Bacteroidetes bacterium GWD2_40_43]|nr:MAG: hypothetical protein A2W96_01060 [Bacteroidetes bacterium GWD2_40_43]OFY18842.1 MAG: hypothetical protein A2W88_06330 [Bacteroidetes bacterium GWF2_40_13]HBX85142.1 hypothetical protein [Marinilabiliales bacterium]HCC29204.1 hypothetical protein [Marinilabiliales bacterium]